MARINFEDDVEAQDEFWELLRLVGGDRDLALGKLVRFFRVAQKAWGHDQPMTEDDLRSRGFAVMIESGWAIPVQGGYHALGAAKHFGWYRQRVAGGEARADGKRDENGQFAAHRSPTDRPPIDQRNPISHQPLTLSLSPTLSLSQKNKELSEGRNPPQASDSSTPVRDFLSVYVKAYQQRYPGTRPEIIPSVQSQARALIKSVGLPRACDLIQVYCQMDEDWFLKKSHDFSTFMGNLNVVAKALDTGQVRDGINWSRVFGSSAS